MRVIAISTLSGMLFSEETLRASGYLLENEGLTRQMRANWELCIGILVTSTITGHGGSVVSALDSPAKGRCSYPSSA